MILFNCCARTDAEFAYISRFLALPLPSPPPDPHENSRKVKTVSSVLHE